MIHIIIINLCYHYSMEPGSSGITIFYYFTIPYAICTSINIKEYPLISICLSAYTPSLTKLTDLRCNGLKTSRLDY